MEEDQVLWKKYLSVFLGVFVVGFVLGMASSNFMKTTIGTTSENTYQAGWDAAKKRLADSPAFGPMANGPAEILSRNGSVQSVNGDKISIKINPVEPLADPALDTRTVVVTDATIVTRIVPRDTDVLKKEMEVFIEQMKKPPVSGKEPATPPISFTRETAKAGDIKVGDRVTVTAGENVKNMKEFGVTSIEIQ
jgi:hypothetical protein